MPPIGQTEAREQGNPLIQGPFNIFGSQVTEIGSKIADNAGIAVHYVFVFKISIQLANKYKFLRLHYLENTLEKILNVCVGAVAPSGKILAICLASVYLALCHIQSKISESVL